MSGVLSPSPVCLSVCVTLLRCRRGSVFQNTKGMRLHLRCSPFLAKKNCRTDSWRDIHDQAEHLPHQGGRRDTRAVQPRACLPASLAPVEGTSAGGVRNTSVLPKKVCPSLPSSSTADRLLATLLCVVPRGVWSRRVFNRANCIERRHKSVRNKYTPEKILNRRLHWQCSFRHPLEVFALFRHQAP